jgi:hypothetical protein
VGSISEDAVIEATLSHLAKRLFQLKDGPLTFINPRADSTGKFSSLATTRHVAMVTFTDDSSCVKSIDIFARNESAPKRRARSRTE